jgi:hypothetical protein
MKEGIELDVRHVQDARQRAGQGRLARSRAPDDGDPFDVNAPARSA